MTFEDDFEKDLIQRLKDDEFAREYIRFNKPFTRCKDCKYWYNDEYETEGYCDLTKYFHMTADDFCSRGERKDE